MYVSWHGALSLAIQTQRDKSPELDLWLIIVMIFWPWLHGGDCCTVWRLQSVTRQNVVGVCPSSGTQWPLALLPVQDQQHSNRGLSTLQPPWCTAGYISTFPAKGCYSTKFGELTCWHSPSPSMFRRLKFRQCLECEHPHFDLES